MLDRRRKQWIAASLAAVLLLVWWTLKEDPRKSDGFPMVLSEWLMSGSEPLAVRDIDARIEWICGFEAYQNLGDALEGVGLNRNLSVYIPDGSFALFLDLGRSGFEYSVIDYGTYRISTQARKCHGTTMFLAIRVDKTFGVRDLEFQHPDEIAA